MPGCASGNYFNACHRFDVLEHTGWEFISIYYKPKSSCKHVSQVTSARYRSDSFPTCKVQGPIIINYKNVDIKGYDDKSAISVVRTKKIGPKKLCANLLEENVDFYVEELDKEVTGKIGCAGNDQHFYTIEGLTLKNGPNEASGSILDPIGVEVNRNMSGTLEDNYLSFSFTQAIDELGTSRTDYCEGEWNGEYFSDDNCELVEVSGAGADCPNIWFTLTPAQEAVSSSRVVSPIIHSLADKMFILSE